MRRRASESKRLVSNLTARARPISRRAPRCRIARSDGGCGSSNMVFAREARMDEAGAGEFERRRPRGGRALDGVCARSTSARSTVGAGTLAAAPRHQRNTMRTRSRPSESRYASIL